MPTTISKVNDSIRQTDNALEQQAKLTYYQRLVFASTFLNYALAHWTRKSYTNVKTQLMHAGVDPLTLTAMDSGFMFTYAGGSFITGQLGDKFSPVTVVAAGLIGSTVCLLLIAYGASTSIINNVALCSTWFLTCQMLHGAFQATGGPVNTKIMGNWFSDKNERGLVFGLWTCHQYIGDIAAALASAYIIHAGYDWKLCITIPAIINGIWGIYMLVSCPDSPEDRGIDTEESLLRKAKLVTEKIKGNSMDSVKAPQMGFCQAIMVPNVMNYAIAFGFFKLVNYAMFFQLPVILNSHFDSSTANMISALYSVGMMPGGIICGYLSDYMKKRAVVIAIFMAILCPLLYTLSQYMDTLPISVLLLMLGFMGILVGGPNNIITSAVSADLADDPSLKGNKSLLGTITGIINGSGSVTAAFGQLAIPILYKKGIADQVGYRYVWYFLIFCTVVGTGLMYPSIAKELKPAAESVPLNSGTKNTYSAVKQSDRV